MWESSVKINFQIIRAQLNLVPFSFWKLVDNCKILDNFTAADQLN